MNVVANFGLRLIQAGYHILENISKLKLWTI